MGSPLAGRVAIVTGGGQGMGRAHCIELAKRGAQIAVLDLDGDTASHVASEIEAAGGTAIGFTCDVTSREMVENVVDAVVAAWDRIDIVVSNAGLVNDERGIEDTDDAEWRRMIEVNLAGCLNITRATVPWVKKSATGRYVIISSAWGQVPPGHSYSYIAAKGALMAFAKNLAVELAPFQITANSIAPGSIRTRMIPDPERELEMYPVPIGRLAEPEEISYLICYLASDEAAFMTGQTLGINGGTPIVGI
jgi:NAD(P)-dependent dehydrogenase (short-subunit alcohol dehydrogenase family)